MSDSGQQAHAASNRLTYAFTVLVENGEPLESVVRYPAGKTKVGA